MLLILKSIDLRQNIAALPLNGGLETLPTFNIGLALSTLIGAS